MIYRTTYDSDADWAEFLRRLRFQMEDIFDYYNGRDILDKFSLTVFEDRSLLDGATTNTIRQIFFPAVVINGVPDRAAVGRRQREQCRQDQNRPISTLPLRRTGGCSGVALDCPRRTRSARVRHHEEGLGQVDRQIVVPRAKRRQIRPA